MSEEQPGNVKPKSDHILARAIATVVIVGAGYAISKVANYEITSSAAFFILFVFAGSYFGNLIGYFIGNKIAAK